MLLSLPIFLEYRSNRDDNKSIGLKTESALKRFGFSLEEVSEKSGVDFIHFSPRLDPRFEPILPQIASMGASVSVCDFDNDGWNDFYVTNSRYNSKNSLYHNQKNGVF